MQIDEILDCLLLALIASYWPHTLGPLPRESPCVQRAAPPEIVARAGGLGKSPSVLLVVIPQGSSSRAKSGGLVVIAQRNSSQAKSGTNRLYN